MVAEVLQLAELVELNGVTDVEVGSRRVESLLDAQRLAARKLLGELAFHDELVGAALEHGKVVVEVEGHCGRGVRGGRAGGGGDLR